MAGLNKAILIGFLGRNPDVRYMASGMVVANFSLATSENWKDKDGEKQTRTEWHRIVAFGKLGEICGEYLRKGKQVYIEGRIQTRSYEKDGGTRYVTQIVASQMVMLGSGNSQDDKYREDLKRYDEQIRQQSNSKEHAEWADDNNDDEIPF